MAPCSYEMLYRGPLVTEWSTCVGRGAWGVGRGAWGVGRGALGVGRGAWKTEEAHRRFLLVQVAVELAPHVNTRLLGLRRPVDAGLAREVPHDCTALADRQLTIVQHR